MGAAAVLMEETVSAVAARKPRRGRRGVLRVVPDTGLRAAASEFERWLTDRGVTDADAPRLMEASGGRAGFFYRRRACWEVALMSGTRVVATVPLAAPVDGWGRLHYTRATGWRVVAHGVVLPVDFLSPTDLGVVWRAKLPSGVSYDRACCRPGR